MAQIGVQRHSEISPKETHELIRRRHMEPRGAESKISPEPTKWNKVTAKPTNMQLQI